MSVREIGGVPFQMPERDLPRADASAEAAATAFESYYCEMLIKEKEKTLPKGFLAEGPMEVLSTLVDRALADAMAAGGGMGIGRKLSEQLDAAPTGAMHTGKLPSSLSNPGGLPVRGTLTSGFGMRIHPILGDWRMHKGVDIGAEQGTPIHPIAPGVVQQAETRDGYGRMVVVDHGGGYTSLYAHCDRLDVAVGQRVDTTTSLGTVGSTGLSTGPHLHLELHQNGEAINPATLWSTDTITVGKTVSQNTPWRS